MAEMDKAIRVINTASVRKIAKRCGALFELENSLEEEFKDVKLRGFTSGSVVNNGRKEFIYKTFSRVYHQKKAKVFVTIGLLGKRSGSLRGQRRLMKKSRRGQIRLPQKRNQRRSEERGSRRMLGDRGSQDKWEVNRSR